MANTNVMLIVGLVAIVAVVCVVSVCSSSLLMLFSSGSASTGSTPPDLTPPPATTGTGTTGTGTTGTGTTGTGTTTPDGSLGGFEFDSTFPGEPPADSTGNTTTPTGTPTGVVFPVGVSVMFYDANKKGIQALKPGKYPTLTRPASIMYVFVKPGSSVTFYKDKFITKLGTTTANAKIPADKAKLIVSAEVK